MAHAQKPDSVFRQYGRVHLNRRGRQFSRLLAAEVCASAVVMLDTPCSEVVWRVLATYFIRQFPLHFPTPVSPCAITFQLDSTNAACGQMQILECADCTHSDRTLTLMWQFLWTHNGCTLRNRNVVVVLVTVEAWTTDESPFDSQWRRYFSLLQSAQSGFGDHRSPLSVSTWSKAAGAWSWPLTWV